MRNTYDATSDPELCDRLVNDFDAKFDHAYPGSYRKPKHHCIKHLRTYLQLCGPFRNYGCMGFEGFLQVREVPPRSPPALGTLPPRTT